MLFDLDGRLRKTTVPASRPLLPVFEAVANSFHAIQEARRPDGEIIVEFMRESTLDPECKGHIDSVIIQDNGSGFTEDNYHAFETADTTYKLALGGKGVGRFTWLVAFAGAVIVSRYNDGANRRAFRFTARGGIEDEPKFDPDLLPAAGTTVELYGFKSPWRERSPRSIDLTAADIIEHFIALFMGSVPPPEVVLIDGTDRLELRSEFLRTYDTQANHRQFAIEDDSFTVTGLRLRRRQAGRSHRLLYLADQREVKTEGLIAHLPGLPNPLGDERGSFHFVGFVQGDALDRFVDADRSSFRIPETEEGDNGPGLFRQLTWRDLRGGALGVVRQELASWLDEIDREKRARIESFVAQQEPQYQVLMKDIDKIVADVPARPSNADIDRAMSRRLFERREMLKTEPSAQRA
jgi:hypothetical protein